MANYSEWRKLLSGKRSLYAWAVAVIGTLVYLPSIAPDALPGLSASLLSEHSGAGLFAPISNVLWGWTASIFEYFPFGTAAFRWNLVSAICGILNSVLIFLLTTSLIGNQLDREVATDDSKSSLRHYAGLTAALLYMFTEPVRHVSAMAHPINFHLSLLLSSLWFLTLFLNRKSLIFGASSLLLFGLSLTQYPTTLLFAPFYAGFFIYGIWKGHLYRPIQLAAFTSAFLLSCIPFLVSILLFMRDPSYGWADMSGYGGVIWNAMREYYVQLRHTVPEEGITIVLLVAVAPFIFTVLIPKRNRAGYRSLMLVGLIICVMMFYQWRPAPWPMFGTSPLLVMPYVIAAIWSGCLATYALGMIRFSIFILRHRSSAPSRALVIEWCCIALNVALIIGAATVTHLNINSTAYPQGVIQAAEQIAVQVESGSWVMADRTMEPLIRIKAKEQEKTFVFITPSRFNHPPYQNALCETIDDNRLCNMVRVGFVPFLREAFHPSRTEEPNFVIMGNPAIMDYVQKPVRPDTVFYTTRWDENESLDDYHNRLLDAWSRIGENLQNQSVNESQYQTLQKGLLQDLSRIANDTGVWLDDMDRPDLARETYRESIRLFEYNLSARLNLSRHINEEDEEFIPLMEEIEAISARLRGNANINQIMDTYGFIRHSRSRIADAVRWKRAGASEMAMQTLKKNDMIQGIEEALANQNDEEAYQFLLAAITSTKGGITNDPQALPEVTRLSAMKGRILLAEKFTQLMQEYQIPESMVAIEKANIDMIKGNRDEAYQTLSALDETMINDPRAWVMLALLTADTRKTDCDRYLAKCETYPNMPAQYLLPIAKIYLSRGDIDSAKRHLQSRLRQQPFDQESLRLLLNVKIQQNQLESAMPIIQQLLQIDTRDALANNALGLRFYQKGRMEAARAAWEVSLESDPLPDVQNNYAFMLHLNGENDRALELIELSLASQPSGMAWHTKSVILIALGRNDEAAIAIKKGLELQPKNTDLLLLQEKRSKAAP